MSEEMQIHETKCGTDVAYLHVGCAAQVLSGEELMSMSKRTSSGIFSTKTGVAIPTRGDGVFPVEIVTDDEGVVEIKVKVGAFDWRPEPGPTPDEMELAMALFERDLMIAAQAASLVEGISAEEIMDALDDSPEMLEIVNDGTYSPMTRADALADYLAIHGVDS
jgi:hypothetical protein